MNDNAMLWLQKMGAFVIWSEKEFDQKLNHWLNNAEPIQVNFPDETEEVIKNLIKKSR